MVNFFSKNRQALINTLGVYFVFATAVHNYRVQIAWDEREIEFRAMENELERVKSGLNDAEWAAAAEDRIYNIRYKRGAPPSGETLVREVQQVVQWKPMTAEEKVAEAAKRRGNIGNRGSADSYVGQAAAMIANVGPGASNPVPAQKEAAVEGNKKEEGGLKMV